MSDAESTVAVEKTVTTCASAPASSAQEPASVVQTTTVVETRTVVVETSRTVAADPTATDRTRQAGTHTAATLGNAAAPTLSNAAASPATAAVASTAATPSPGVPNVAALMSRRFRGYLPVVIDVETGGFHSSTDALLEIAAVLIDMEPDGTLKRGATHSFHVKPFEGARLDPAALAITGIDPFHPLRPALPEKDALGRIFREIRHAVHAYNCRRAILVGHNAAFDLGFLNAAVTRADVKRNPFHPFSCFDTATLAGAALGQTVLAKALAVAGLKWDPSSAHSASYDAEQTADMFCLICNRLSGSFHDAQERARKMGWVQAAPPAADAAEDPSLET
jgi:ribonuclease T